MSATYRQTSDYRSDLTDTDPGNRLLARQNRFRVEAEIVRDLYLQAAGLLSPKIGGPSVFPPFRRMSPPSVTPTILNGMFPRARISIAAACTLFINAPHPILIWLCSIALMRLSPINSETVPTHPCKPSPPCKTKCFFDGARAMAKKLVTEKLPSEEERLRTAFLTTLGRPASSSELQVLLQLLNESRDWYKANPKKAVELIGDYKSDNVPPEQLAAWITTSRIILNTDEFITRS